MEWDVQQASLKVKTEIMEAGKQVIMLWLEPSNDITFKNILCRVEEMERNGVSGTI